MFQRFIFFFFICFSIKVFLLKLLEFCFFFFLPPFLARSTLDVDEYVQGDISCSVFPLTDSLSESLASGFAAPWSHIDPNRFVHL